MMLFVGGSLGQHCVSAITGAAFGVLALVLVIGSLAPIAEVILLLVDAISDESTGVDITVADCAPTVDPDVLACWLGGFAALVGGILGLVWHRSTVEFPLEALLLAAVVVVALGWYVGELMFRLARR